MSDRTPFAPATNSSGGRGAGARWVFAAATLGGGFAGIALERALEFSWPPSAGFSFINRHAVAAIATSLGFLFGLAHRSRAGRRAPVSSLFERVLFVAGLAASFSALPAALALGKGFDREYGAVAALLALALGWAGVVALGLQSASAGRVVESALAPEAEPARAGTETQAECTDGADALGAAFRELCRNIEEGSPGASPRERAQRELHFQRALTLLIRIPRAEAATALGEAVRLDSIGASKLREQAIELLAASPHWLHIEVLLGALPRDLPVIAAQAIDALADRLDPFHEDDLAALRADRDPFVARVATAVMARRAES